MQNQPDISRRAFWDIDYNNIEWDNQDYRQYLLIKIFNHGTIEDIQNAIRYYGKELVIAELTSAEKLPETVYYLALSIFQLKPTDFQCSITKL